MTNKKNKKVVKPAEPKFFGFKVVVKEDGKLVSATSAGLKVHYITDKFVYPRRWGGPLTVFNTLGRAMMFKEEKMSDTNPDNIKVYKCEYIPTIVEHVWRYRGGEMKTRRVSELPEMTMVAKAIKLMKKVA